MDELVFKGRVVNGIGRHAELHVPGKSLLSAAPDDWPEKPYPGSLNILVTQWPDAFSERKLAHSAKSLDMGGFAPAFTIPQNEMGNNQLGPRPDMAHRGTAQVWRALLNASDKETPCWVLRRFGSGLRDHIELVSEVGLRDSLGLSRDKEWPASLRMFGEWQS